MRATRMILLGTAALWPVALHAQAQQVPAGPDVLAATDAEDAEIIVTGTSVGRTAVDTPLAVTALGEERLAKLTSSSQADILNSVPTIKADGGGCYVTRAAP